MCRSFRIIIRRSRSDKNNILNFSGNLAFSNELHHEETCSLYIRLGQTQPFTQTLLCSHKIRLVAFTFIVNKGETIIIHVAKINTPIGCEVTCICKKKTT